MLDFFLWVLFVLGIASIVGMLIDSAKKRRAEPVKGWEEAFADSRARGLNTDAYTFQIAWAYAQQHFESMETTCPPLPKPTHAPRID